MKADCLQEEASRGWCARLRGSLGWGHPPRSLRPHLETSGGLTEVGPEDGDWKEPLSSSAPSLPAWASRTLTQSGQGHGRWNCRARAKVNVQKESSRMSGRRPWGRPAFMGGSISPNSCLLGLTRSLVPPPLLTGPLSLSDSLIFPLAPLPSPPSSGRVPGTENAGS